MTARAATTLVFALNGLAVGTWGSRVPAIQDHLGVGPGPLALVLGALAGGALVAMPLSGRASSRHGSRRITALGIVATGLALPLPALLPGLALVALGALAVGAANGTVDVAMNAQGVAVERVLRRPVLSSMHAGFSFGGLAGAGLGALAAAAGIGALPHFAAVGALVAAAGAVAARALLADRPVAGRAPARPHPATPGRSAARSRALWALRLLAFCCLLAEGAAMDWSAVHLRTLGAGAAAAALGYAAFSLTMASGRLAGDRLVLRFGPVRLGRWGGALGAGALGLALLTGAPAVALLAYLCLGAGLSLVIPLVFRAAAAGADAGPALAAVTSTGYLGFLAGPPIIGALASATSLPAALTVVVAATAAVATGAGVLRRGGAVAEAPPSAAVAHAA